MAFLSEVSHLQDKEQILGRERHVIYWLFNILKAHCMLYSYSFLTFLVKVEIMLILNFRIIFIFSFISFLLYANESSKPLKCEVHRSLSLCLNPEPRPSSPADWSSLLASLPRLALSKSSVNISRMNEWMNEMLPFLESSAFLVHLISLKLFDYHFHVPFLALPPAVPLKSLK